MKIKPKKSVQSLQAYNPGLFSAKYKLDANESPYDLPPVYKNRIMKKLAKIQFNRYPDSAARELKKAVARRNKVKPENIFFGNGSDEIINYLLQAFCAPGDSIIIPVPTFEMYRIAGIINCNRVMEVPLDKDMDLDEDKIIGVARKTRAKFIFLAYPNNPTGNCFSEDRVLHIIKNAGCFVAVDEAYLEFSGKTFAGRMKKHRNLIILRTFSKLYSAAIRLGYMIADKSVIAAAEKVRLPYNINSLSQAAALEILKLGQYTARVAALIRKERDLMHAALNKTYTVQKSDSNFLFIKLKRGADAARKYFQKKGFSIRIWKSGHAQGWMRLTVGTPSENRAAIKLLIGGA